jgi:molybdopterin converting factor subunit 1
MREEEFDVPEGSTAGSLKQQVQCLHERLEAQEKNILIAVNGFFVEPSHLLRQGDEVALFPPVSGG